jgi:hypothetical protein
VAQRVEHERTRLDGVDARLLRAELVGGELLRHPVTFFTCKPALATDAGKVSASSAIFAASSTKADALSRRAASRRSLASSLRLCSMPRERTVETRRPLRTVSRGVAKLLKQVLNWACSVTHPDGTRLLERNPL